MSAPSAGDGPYRRLLSFLAARLSDDATAVLKAMAETDPVPAQDGGPDPEHLLHDVVAKRALLQAWFEGRHDRFRATGPAVPDAVIAGLAGEYRDHPDFDPGWLRSRGTGWHG